MKRLLYTSVILLQTIFVWSQIFPFRMSDKYALVKGSFPNLITPPVFYEAPVEVGKHRYFIVTLGYQEGYGLIDSLGKEKIKPGTFSNYRLLVDKAPPHNTYIVFVKEAEELLCDFKGNLILKTRANIWDVCGDLTEASVNKTDSVLNAQYFINEPKADRLYGLMDLKGNWFVKPSRKNYQFKSATCIKAIDHTNYPKNTYYLYNQKLQAIITESLTDIVDIRYERYGEIKLNPFKAENDETEWIVDSSGKILSQQTRTFEPKIHYKNGLQGVSLGKKNIVPAKYDVATITAEHLFGYTTATNKTDIYDKKGNLVATKEFSDVFSGNNERKYPLRHERIFCYKKEGIFLLNENFDPIGPVLSSVNTREIDEVGYPERMTLIPCEVKYKYGIINEKGKVIVPFNYNSKPYISYNIIYMSTGYNSYDTYTYKGELIAKSVQTVTQSLVNPNLFFVEKNKAVAVHSINPSGTVIPFKRYDRITEAYFQKRIIGWQNGKCTVMNEYLKPVSTELVHNVETNYNDTLNLVVDRGKRKQLLDPNLKKVSEEFDVLEFNNDHYRRLYKVALNGKYGIMDMKGKMLLNLEWDKIDAYPGYSIVKQNGKIFIADSLLNVDKTKPIDSTFSTYELGVAYCIDKTWRFIDRRLRDIQFEDIATGYDNVLRLRKYGKWGLYDIEKKTWRVEPLFDSVVHIDSYYNKFPTYTTKFGSSLFVVDPIHSALIGQGFDKIESFYHAVDPEPQDQRIPGYMVNIGGQSDDNYRIRYFYGGRSGLMNEKGDLMRPMDAAFLLPLIYDDTQTTGRRSLLGFLWNTGGTAKKFETEQVDPYEREAFDSLGNFFMEHVPAHPLFEDRIIGGKFGIIGANGKEIFPVVYDDIKFGFVLNEGGHYKRFGFRDSVHFRPRYNLIIDPLFLCKDGKWGMGDLSGKILIPVEHDSIETTTLNYQVVKAYSKGAYGYFDRTGKQIISMGLTAEQDYFVNHSEQNWMLIQKGGSAVSYSVAGDTIEEAVFDPEGNETIVRVSTPLWQQDLTGGKYGFYNIDKNKLVVEPVYDEIICSQRFRLPDGSEKTLRRPVSGKSKYNRSYKLNDHEGFDLNLGGKWGRANEDGKIVAQCLYDSIGDFDNHRLTRVWQSGMFGFTDANAKLVVPAQFSAYKLFSIDEGAEDEEILLLQKGGSVRTYTVVGDSVDALEYDSYGNQNVVRKPQINQMMEIKGGTYGLYDMKKKVMLLEALYEDITEESQGIEKNSYLGSYNMNLDHSIKRTALHKIKQNNKWGVFLLAKGIILKPEYDEVTIKGEEIIAKIAGAEKRFTLEGKPK